MQNGTVKHSVLNLHFHILSRSFSEYPINDILPSPEPIQSRKRKTSNIIIIIKCFI